MSSEEKLKWLEKIDEALDQVRPHLAIDGGNVEVLDLRDDMTVMVRWLGTCQSCSMSDMSLKAGLEETLKQSLPAVQRVVAVNHADVELPDQNHIK